MQIKKINMSSWSWDIQPWWISGLICHVLNSSRDRQLGPEFESRSRQFYELIYMLTKKAIINLVIFI